MEKIINLIKLALSEKRRLTDKEMELIIETLLSYYKVLGNVVEIRIDYHDEYNKLAGFDSDNKILYFNMNELNEQIFKQFYNEKKVYSFNEFFVLEQLSVIFHEIRHVLQNSDYFDNKEVIKRVIMASNLRNYSNEVYERFYSLFPIEKDAIVFSCDETTKLLDMCDYFDQSTINSMYTFCVTSLIKGYNFANSREGSLKEFYEKVVGNSEEYYRLQQLSNKLTTHDKMSFNFSLNDDDLKKILLVPGLIAKGFNPGIVLKKEIRYK